METKKNQKVDLEPHKSMFFKIGLILSLSAVLFAFEWKKSDNIETIIENDGFNGIDDPFEVIPTKSTPPKPPSIPISWGNLKVIPDGKATFDIGYVFEPDTLEVAYTPIVDVVETGISDITDSAKVIVDFDAEFPGGIAAMRQFFSENITYPEEERKIGMEGTLYVKFIVEKNGNVSNVGIARSLSYNLDNEALKVIKMMPKWKPASDHGRSVRQFFTIPFSFKIKNN